MVGETTGGHVWLEKLTDDANPWLTAVRMEEQGELLKAALLYLDDATKCLEEGTIVRAALGAVCASDCLARLGMPARARRLYHVAGMLYWDNADARMGESVRESLWSLQEAHESFLLAGETDNANHVELLFTSLARRANPFIGERDAFRLASKTELGVGVAESAETQGNGGEQPNLAKAFDEFLRARERQRERDAAARKTARRPADKEMEMLDAQGFIGQLG